MSPLRLMPKDERFFELFIADGENLLAAARELEALVTSYDRVEERVDAIRALEHQGDEIGDDLTDKIERAFITPFDRGDIHELAARLDDVVDGIQEIAETFLLYGITQPTDEAQELAQDPPRPGGEAPRRAPEAGVDEGHGRVPQGHPHAREPGGRHVSVGHRGSLPG